MFPTGFSGGFPLTCFSSAVMQFHNTPLRETVQWTRLEVNIQYTNWKIFQPESLQKLNHILRHHKNEDVTMSYQSQEGSVLMGVLSYHFQHCCTLFKSISILLMHSIVLQRTGGSTYRFGPLYILGKTNSRFLFQDFCKHLPGTGYLILNKSNQTYGKTIPLLLVFLSMLSKDLGSMLQ